MRTNKSAPLLFMYDELEDLKRLYSKESILKIWDEAMPEKVINLPKNVMIYGTKK